MGIPGRSPSRLVGYTCQYLRYYVRANVRYIARTNDAPVKRKFQLTVNVRTLLPYRSPTSPLLFPWSIFPGLHVGRLAATDGTGRPFSHRTRSGSRWDGNGLPCVRSEAGPTGRAEGDPA